MKNFFLITLLLPFNAFSQTLCEDGFAGIYPCENVDLLYHVIPDSIGGASTNEVWGWTDALDGKEYVLLGMSTGVGFFDIANPLQPLYLGKLPTHTVNSLWRTLRTYNDYLFVGSEASAHGLQIFDLTRLRDVDSPPQDFTEDAYYNGFGKCHTLVIDETSGYLYAVGTNTYSGGLHVVNIQDPLNPIIAGGYDGSGYTHEAQVLQYNGPDTEHIGKSIALCFNGSAPTLFAVMDVTDPTDIMLISSAVYPSPAYCHQGWLTPDGGYLLMDDELDENNFGLANTRTLIWDMNDLDQPIYMGDHLGTTAAIDHNQYIIGNLCYQSNYTAGLQIQDVTDIADTTLQQVAFFDHYPVNNSTQFQSEWMNYPYFASGIMPLTDIYNGMFLVKPNFIQIEANETACANEVINIQVIIQEGFLGPYTLNLVGLPEEVIVNYSTEGVVAPDTITIELSSLVNFVADLNFSITVQGLYNTYTREVAIELIQPTTWYYDADIDGFGLDTDSIIACEQPASYSNQGGDCNDENSFVYPGAPGTYDDVDNNCNSILDIDEIAFCADLDGDNIITILDLIIMNGELGCEGLDCLGDLNDDGLVNINDFLLVLADFGEECNQ